MDAEYIQIPKPAKKNTPKIPLVFSNYLMTFNLYLSSLLLFQNIFIRIFLLVLVNLFFINFAFGKARLENIFTWNIILCIMIIFSFNFYSLISMYALFTLFINFIYLRKALIRSGLVK